MTIDIPRTPLDAEPRWLDQLGHGADLGRAGREVLAHAFKEACVQQGAYDQRIAEWLGGFELSVAIAAASWIVRAYETGLQEGARRALESSTAAALDRLAAAPQSPAEGSSSPTRPRTPVTG